MAKKTFKKIKLPPEQPMMIKAKKLGRSLYRAYIQEEKAGRNCGNLLLDWIKESFWGSLVKDHLPIFNELWELLNKKGHTRKNPFGYGDIDYDVWVEYPKDNNKQVIVSICYCACADDNTHIFIYDKELSDPKIYSTYDWSKFRVATVWKRQKSNDRWPNDEYDRNIDVPSLSTYRKRDFRYGYYDCRDKGHVLLYEAHSERVEKASWSETEIYWALWNLRSHLRALKDEK